MNQSIIFLPHKKHKITRCSIPLHSLMICNSSQFIDDFLFQLNETNILITHKKTSSFSNFLATISHIISHWHILFHKKSPPQQIHPSYFYSIYLKTFFSADLCWHVRSYTRPILKLISCSNRKLDFQTVSNLSI